MIDCVCEVGFLKYESLALSRSRERAGETSGMMKYFSRENDDFGVEIFLLIIIHAFRIAPGALWRPPEMF